MVWASLGIVWMVWGGAVCMAYDVVVGAGGESDSGLG